MPLRPALLLIATLPLGSAFAAEEAGTATYGKGFTIEHKKAKLAIGGRVQARYQHASIDTEPDPTISTGFYLPRVRLSLKGKTAPEGLSWAFQYDWGKGGAGLKDAYMDYELADGFRVRAGQFKKNFGREQLNSSSKLALVDRGITDKAFGNGRDIGVLLHNNVTAGEGFEWSAGVFNGLGDNVVPDHLHPLVVLRLAYGSDDLGGYDEVDWKGGGVRFGVGANTAMDMDMDGEQIPTSKDDGTMTHGLDFMMRSSGFTATLGGYMMSVQDGADFTSQTGAANGAYVQANYLIDKVAPAARFAVVMPEGDDNDSQEMTLGVGVYGKKHNLKWQTDAGMLSLEVPGDKLNTTLVRSQVQAAF